MRRFAHPLLRAIALLLAFLPGFDAVAGAPTHGIAMHGEPALPPDFPHFPYADPEAPKGGRLVLGLPGTFDGLNPFVVKGVAPDAVSRFVREKRGLQKCVHLGYSWGTALMGRYAADNAAAVERLVLFAPVWNRQGASLADPGGELGAYRYVTQAQARARRGAGVPEAARATLVPAGWFEHWAGVTWATDPEGQRRSPPALRAPNGSVADGREFWGAGRPFYDPAKITAPALLVLGEWDQDTPPYMAQTLFPLLTASPGKRLVLLGEGTHSMWMERNRGALFQAVQVFLEEAAA